MNGYYNSEGGLEMKGFFPVFILSALIIMQFGCASKGYVNKQLELVTIRNQKLDSRISTVRSDIEGDIDRIEKEVNSGQEEITELRDKNERQEERDKKLESELVKIDEKISRVKKDNKPKKRKLLYQVTISDDSVSFAFDRSDLSKPAKEAVDTFAGVLIAENKDVLIEIQGHTDNVGSKKYNLELGETRATAIKRYLHMKHGIPLQRMSVFSYGETKPVTNNSIITADSIFLQLHCPVHTYIHAAAAPSAKVCIYFNSISFSLPWPLWHCCSGLNCCGISLFPS